MMHFLKSIFRVKLLFIISAVSFGTLLIVWNAEVWYSLVYPDPFKLQHENYEWQTMSNEDMEMISQEMNRRRTRISSLCHSNGLNLSKLMKIPQWKRIVKSFFVHKAYKLAWCPIYKASSSAWLEIFAILKGAITPSVRQKLDLETIGLLDVAKEAYPQDKNISRALEDLVNATRFIIVRHPFERLLSAYRDKLENREGREFYYKRYGRSIVRKYRKKYVLKIEPTFEEFLEYIVNLKYYQDDEHWRPYTDSCAPCDLNYHYILKTESLDTEESFLITKLKLQDVLPSKVSIRHINPKGHTWPRYSHKYYSRIPKHLLYRLYQHYEDDFKLFNYSVYDYLPLPL